MSKKILGLKIPTVEPCVRYDGILTNVDKETVPTPKEWLELETVRPTGENDDKVPQEIIDQENKIVNVCGSAITRLLISDPYEFVAEIEDPNDPETIRRFEIEFQFGSNLNPHGHAYQNMLVSVTELVDVDDEEGDVFFITYNDKTGLSSLSDEYGEKDYTEHDEMFRKCLLTLLMVVYGRWDYTDYCREMAEKKERHLYFRHLLRMAVRDPKIWSSALALTSSVIGLVHVIKSKKC